LSPPPSSFGGFGPIPQGIGPFFNFYQLWISDPALGLGSGAKTKHLI